MIGWSWIGKHKDDDDAFIFTLKNPYGVEPTQFLKRKESEYAIDCNPTWGPTFGNGLSDIFIAQKCFNENSCWIENDGKKGYECHPQYKKSLFVNTAGPGESNLFTVEEYEVFTHK